METLTLNDGTVLLNSNVYPDELRLYVYVRNNSNMQEVFNLLIDPEKTVSIIMNADNVEKAFNGFTKLVTITDEGNGTITAVLKKHLEG